MDLMAQQICGVCSSPILFCSKPTCPSKVNPDLSALRPSDHSNPWYSHPVLHSPSPGAREFFLMAQP